MRRIFVFIGMMKLHDVCEICSGYAIKNFYDNKEGYPVVKIGNIKSDGTLDLSNCQFTDELVNNKYYSKKGDIYIALSGATTGKIGMNYSDDIYIINQRVGVVRKVDKNIPDEFIKYFLMNKTKKILDDASGCAQPNISPKQISQYEFPNFDYSKMRFIVDVLDKVSCLIKMRNKEIEKINELVKSRFIEMFGDPTINTNGYPIKELSDIAEYWNGLTYSLEDVSDEGTIVLRSSNIQNFSLDFKDVVRVSCAIGEKKYVKNNDVLMCSRNGSVKLVGKVALIKNINEPMCFGAFMMIIRSQYYQYLMTYFQMPAFRMQINTGATSTINQITGKMLDSVKLPVPPIEKIEEYERFVRTIDKSKFVIISHLVHFQFIAHLHKNFQMFFLFTPTTL